MSITNYKYQRNFNTEEYDRAHNLFYLSIHPKAKKLIGNKKDADDDLTKVSNIVIYDVTHKRSKVLFDNVTDKEVITHLLFETGYDEKMQEIIFNRQSSKIQNNHAIAHRQTYNQLLICQENIDTHDKKLWISKKDGSSLTLLAELDPTTEWRLDVYNRKIRTFRRSTENPSIQDYDW
ncbi:hypothetical protein [Aquimarina sp. 2304DJ70-9]|uniref:hypothetical protein n=1 Tax=Aquimarina penaris TaxID=3231044 RepID=UPI00346336DE